MLVDSRACNPTSTRLSSNKINQPEVIGKIHTEPNDHDQSKVFRTLNFLSISSNYELTFELMISGHGSYTHWGANYGALG